MVTDEGLSERKHPAVLEKVKAYIQQGGLVIIGLHMPNFIDMDAFDNLFQIGFGLTWERGDYHRTTFQFNPSSNLPNTISRGSVPGPYSMKVLHVESALPHEKTFIPVPEAQTQSAVFPPSLVDRAQAAITIAKIRVGHLIYI